MERDRVSYAIYLGFRVAGVGMGLLIVVGLLGGLPLKMNHFRGGLVKRFASIN